MHVLPFGKVARFRRTMTRTEPVYHKFENPLRVEVVCGNTEFDDYNAAFVEISGVTTTIEEYTPAMVIQALGKDPSFSAHFGVEFSSYIAKDFYLQVRELVKMRKVVVAGTEEAGEAAAAEDNGAGKAPAAAAASASSASAEGKQDEADEEDSVIVLEPEYVARGIVFHMRVVERPHHTFFVLVEDTLA